mgnify:CR=1 FL=1
MGYYKNLEIASQEEEADRSTRRGRRETFKETKRVTEILVRDLVGLVLLASAGWSISIVLAIVLGVTL